jgi:hypothetical protein
MFQSNDGIKISGVTSDPLMPVNGMIIYRLDLNKFRKYENGAWSDFTPSTSASSRITARAYKTADTAYSAGEVPAFNLTNWSKSDSQSIIDLTNSRFSIPSSFTGTVRVKVTFALAITSANSFSNWRILSPLVRRVTPSALLVGYGKDWTVQQISAGSPAAGTTGSGLISGEASFEALANEVYQINFYTNQNIVTDSQGFISWCLIELEAA